MRFRLVPLEERIVLDAAMAAHILNSYHLEAIKPLPNVSMDSIPMEQSSNHTATDITKSLLGLDYASSLHSQPINVLVISSQVTDPQVLEAATKEPAYIVFYDATKTTLAQLTSEISQVLHGQQADSIAFVNNGEPGSFALTSSIQVTQQTLNTNLELQSFWSNIGGMIKNGGQVDLLSCYVGSDAQGQLLANNIDTLLDSNGKNISLADASHKVSNTDEGGSWDLNVVDGKNAGLSFDASKVYFNTTALQSWTGALDPSPLLIKTIQTSGGTSVPANFLTMGSNIFFKASPNNVDENLYMTNGTAGNLTQITGPGVSGSAANITTVTYIYTDGTTLYFFANDESNASNYDLYTYTQASGVVERSTTPDTAGYQNLAGEYGLATSGYLYYSAPTGLTSGIEGPVAPDFELYVYKLSNNSNTNLSGSNPNTLDGFGPLAIMQNLLGNIYLIGTTTNTEEMYSTVNGGALTGYSATTNASIYTAVYAAGIDPVYFSTTSFVPFYLNTGTQAVHQISTEGLYQGGNLNGFVAEDLSNGYFYWTGSDRNIYGFNGNTLATTKLTNNSNSNAAPDNLFATGGKVYFSSAPLNGSSTQIDVFEVTANTAGQTPTAINSNAGYTSISPFGVSSTGVLVYTATTSSGTELYENGTAVAAAAPISITTYGGPEAGFAALSGSVGRIRLCQSSGSYDQPFSIDTTEVAPTVEGYTYNSFTNSRSRCYG